MTLTDDAPPGPVREPETGDEALKSTPELDADGLLVRLTDWWKEDEPICSAFHKEAEQDFQFRAGEQWPEGDKTYMEDGQERPTLTFNFIDTIVDAVAGAEITNRQEVRFIPRQIENAGVNDVLTEAARWFRDQCEADHEESAAFSDAATCGMGWTETRLDYEDNPDGDTKIEKHDVMEMFWDGCAKQANLIDARRIWRVRMEVPLAEVKAKWPNDAMGDPIEDDSDYHAGWASVGQDTGNKLYVRHDPGTPLQHEGSEPSKETMVTLVQVQWWEREEYYRAMVIDPTTGTPQISELTPEQHLAAGTNALQMGLQYKGVRQTRKIRYQAFVGAKILEVSELKAPSGKRAAHFTMVPITGKWDRNKKTFYGLVRGMRDPQTFTNKWLSTTVETMARGSKGGLMIETGAVEDSVAFERDWAKPGANSYFTTGALTAGKVQPKPPVVYPADLMQMTQFAIGSIRNVSGVNTETLGATGQDQPASLEYQRRQSTTAVLAPLFDSLRRYRRLQGKMLLYYITEFLSDGRLVRIVGKEGEKYVPLTRNPGTVEYDVIVDDAPSSPSQKELVWNSMMQMLPLMTNIQVPPEVYMTLLDYSPMPASVVAKIKQVVSDAQQNQQPQPSPQELMTQQAQVEIETEKAKSQGQIESKRQQALIEAQHKRELANIDVARQLRTEEIKLDSKRQEMTMSAHFKGIDMSAEADHKRHISELERAATPAPPPPPDHMPALLELIQKVATQKRPKGIKRTQGGMVIEYD